MLKDYKAYKKFREKYIELKKRLWKTTEYDLFTYFEKYNTIYDELSSIGIPLLLEV